MLAKTRCKMSKSVLIEIDIVKILKETQTCAMIHRENVFLMLMVDASVDLSALYKKEDWTNEELFESYEKWAEWIQTQEECKYLKVKVVFL